VAVTYHFEWYPRKAAGNLRKHGVDFEQAATVFLDPFQLTIFDESHSEQDEERWVTLGQAESGTLLAVVHTYREISEAEAVIRLISARPATKREQRQYEDG
jgi:uncharacterized DUF497 family protein